MSKPTGIVRPLGLALVLAAGFGTVFAAVAGWGIALWEGMRRQANVNQYVSVRADVTPLIRRDTYDTAFRNETYYALDGSEVPRPDEDTNWLSGAYLNLPLRNIHVPLEGNERVARFTDARTPPALWYFVHDGARDGRGYFVGYQCQSKLCVGFIGRNGLRPDRPPVAEWFPVDGGKFTYNSAFSRFQTRSYQYDIPDHERPGEIPLWKVDMICGAQLLEVDLRNGSVATLMESPNLIAVGILTTISKWKAEGDEAPRAHSREKLALRTTDRVIVFDPPGKQHAAYLLPQELRDRNIELYELDAGTALVKSGRRLADGSWREELFWIATAGKVLREAEVPQIGGNRRDDENERWAAALALPVPVLLAVGAAVIEPLDYVESEREPTYAAALARSLAVWWPTLLVVTLLSVALAWYCCRRQRRYYQRYSGVWVALVLLGGLPGLVGYLCHRRWPVLERCPACGQAVPRDRETCAACGAAFPPPAPKGCEVFA